MDYLIGAISFLAACVAIFGKTVDEERQGALWRRITPVGYATACVAVGALIAGIVAVHQKQRDASKHEDFALQLLFDQVTQIGRSAANVEYLNLELSETRDRDRQIETQSAFRLSVERDVSFALAGRKAILDQVSAMGSNIPLPVISAVTPFRGDLNAESELGQFRTRNFQSLVEWALRVEKQAAALNAVLCKLSNRPGHARMLDSTYGTCNPDGMQWTTGTVLLKKMRDRAKDL